MLRPALAEVSGLGMLSWRLPAKDGCAEVVGLGLLLWRSLVWAWSHGSCYLGPSPTDITGSWRGRSVIPAPTEVNDSCLLLWRSQTQTWSHGGCLLEPALEEVPG